MVIDKKEEQEKVPVFKSWKGWYLLVLGTLTMLIIIFFIISRSYSG